MENISNLNSLSALGIKNNNANIFNPSSIKDGNGNSVLLQYFFRSKKPTLVGGIYDEKSNNGSARTPELGRSYLFDGSDDVVDCNSAITLWKDSTKPWKINFSFTATNVSGVKRLIAQQLYGGTYRGVSVVLVDNQLYLNLCCTATTDELTAYANGLTLVAETAYEVEITYSGSKLYTGITFKVNGTTYSPIATNTTLTSANIDSGTNLLLGRDSGGFWHNGKLWGVIITDTTANSIIRFYKCDEQAGTIAYDSSGNAGHGTITNATLGTFHSTQNLYSYQNEVGYSMPNGTHIPRNEAIPTQDVTGQPLMFSGMVPYNGLLKQSNCGTTDGVNDILSLAYTPTAVTNDGTATVGISGNTITFTAGTVFNLVVNQGATVHTYPCAEGYGTVAYDITGGSNGTWTNITLGTFWTKQNSYHKNLVDGFSLYEHATTTKILVPYSSTGSPLSITAPTGYTKSYDCPSGAFHNGAETLIDFTGGIASPVAVQGSWETTWSFNTSRTNPKFKRTHSPKVIGYVADRFLAYRTALTSTNLSKVLKYLRNYSGVATVSLVGDSITNSCSGFDLSPATQNGVRSILLRSYAGFANSILNHAFSLSLNPVPMNSPNYPDMDFGWDGITALQYATSTTYINYASTGGNSYPTETRTPLQVAVSSSPKNFVIMLGTNDCNASEAVDILPRIQTVVVALRATGARVFLCTVLPRTDTGYQTKIDAINAGLPAIASANSCILVPWHTDVMTGATQNTSCFYDTTHPNAKGSSILGKKLASIMVNYINVEYSVPVKGSAKWLSANPYCDIDTNSDGLTDGLVLYYFSTTPAPTLTIDTDSNGNKWQKINETDTGSTGLKYIYGNTIPAGVLSAYITSQKKMRGVCRYEVVSGNITGIQLRADFQETTGYTTTGGAQYYGFMAGSDGVITPHAGLMVTEAISIPVGTNLSSLQVRVYGNGIVKLRQFGWVAEE